MRRPIRQAACRLVGINRRLGLVEAVCGVAQKDQAQDGHEIFVRREPGIGAQIVGDFPEVALEFLNPYQMVSNHWSSRLLHNTLGPDPGFDLSQGVWPRER